MNKRRISIHEAGHVVMAHHLNLPIQFAVIRRTVNEKWNGLSRVLIPISDKSDHTNILIGLSGKVAEELFYGKIDFPRPGKKWDGADDFDNAFRIAYKSFDSSDKVVAYVSSVMGEARQALANYKDEIKKIALHLETKEQITGQEISEIFNQNTYDQEETRATH